MLNTSGFDATVPPCEHGSRLDKALLHWLPQWGLRARRRLCAQGLVLLGDNVCGAGVKVRAGQRIRITASNRNPVPSPEADNSPFLVVRTARVGAVFKPAGLHTVSLAGSASPSLEAVLGHVLEISGIPEKSEKEDVPVLLNRLDQDTSGLVLVALNFEGRRDWQTAETDGTMDKRYVAIVSGAGRPGPCTVRSRLDTCRRLMTRVLANDDPDVLRHTRVRPLGDIPPASVPFLFTPSTCDSAEGEPCRSLYLVGCRIHKGARHQIRAHLSAMGFPLAGDSLYGQPLSHPLYLHHGAVFFADFAALHLPHWLDFLPVPLRDAARFFLTAQPCP